MSVILLSKTIVLRCRTSGASADRDSVEAGRPLRGHSFPGRVRARAHLHARRNGSSHQQARRNESRQRQIQGRISFRSQGQVSTTKTAFILTLAALVNFLFVSIEFAGHQCGLQLRFRSPQEKPIFGKSKFLFRMKIFILDVSFIIALILSYFFLPLATSTAIGRVSG